MNEAKGIKKALENTFYALFAIFVAWTLCWFVWNVVAYDYHKFQRKFPNATFLDWLTE